MQPEETVEIVQRIGSVGAERQRAARRGIVLVAMRRYECQTVESAAQDDHDKTPVSRHRGKGIANRCVPECEPAGGGHGLENRAACRHGAHLRWNSGLHNKSASASAWLSARAMASLVVGCSRGPMPISAIAAESSPAGIR